MASGATTAAANIGMAVAKRPEKQATAGRVVELKTNFIAVSTKFKYPKVHYYSFEVTDMKKKKAGRKDSQKVFEQMRLKRKFGTNALPVFDGGQVYSESQLDIGHRKETRSHTVKVPVDADGSGREKDLRVEIKYQGEIDLSPIGEYVKEGSTSAWDGNIQSNLTVLNAFANNKVRLSYLSVGRRAIFPPSHDNRPIFLPGGIEMKQGFYQSIRPGWGRLTINVDICATTFYPSGPIIDIIPKIIKNKFDRHEKTRDELRRGLDRREIDTLNRFFRNVMVFVTHRRDNRKPKHKVSYIDSQPADQARFRQDNKEITVAQYFKETHRHPLQFGRLPCIVVVKPDKSKVFFPLEVCEICPGQRYEDKLSDDARREMVQKTAIKPWERFDRIERAIKDIFQHRRDENLQSIGMDVDPEFIKVKGRVIQPPKLLTNGTEILPEGGRWDLRKFIKCPRLQNWSVMVFENRNYAPLEMVKNAIKQLCSSLSERGMVSITKTIVRYF